VSRSLVAGALAVALLASLASIAGAQENVVARVLTPISRDAKPGTSVTVKWTLTAAEAGKRRPYRPGYVFVRLVGPGGARTPLAYGVHLLRPGGYRASVKVPRGGVRRVEIGVLGSTRRAKLFRVVGPVFR
jgi:hypothetical protein